MAAQLDLQRKKLEIDILMDNHNNEVNREILNLCKDDLARKQPTRDDFKYEQIRAHIKSQ